MCGFAGLLSRDRDRVVQRSEIGALLSTIHYRGPDGTGFHTAAGIGLGFRRLAIIDPAHGHQPLSNEPQSHWIVFNGEIYNYRELTERLKSKGYRFRTGSDTEALIHAYEEWGQACVEQFRGIFAFAIWNAMERTLFLARDRSGVKPLHLMRHAGDLYFASEAKALLAVPGADRGLDLIGYLGGDEVDPLLERTSFRGIVQLGAGCSMTVRDGQLAPRRYWTYQPDDSQDERSSENLASRFRDLFVDAVRSQLVSDVPIAASLSGGVDSAAVVAAIARMGRPDIRTYTVAFDGDRTRDVEHARIVARALEIDATEVPCIIGTNSVDQFRRIAWLAEGEFDLGYVARFELARKVYSDGAKVLLTGQGIDEILTGYYPSYTDYRRAALTRALRARLMPSYRGFPVFEERVLDEVSLDAVRDHDLLAASGSATMARVTAGQLKADHSRLSSGMLRFEDRMGMGGHVEVRVPFLDHSLLEFCTSLPDSTRAEMFSQKKILRDAVAPWLPPEIARRPKVGFNASAMPLSQLVLESAPGHELGQLLTDGAATSKGYFAAAWCQHLLARRDFAALDHVLIIHLLDELFVTNFNPAEFAEAGNETRESPGAASETKPSASEVV